MIWKIIGKPQISKLLFNLTLQMQQPEDNSYKNEWNLRSWVSFSVSKFCDSEQIYFHTSIDGFNDIIWIRQSIV